MTAPQRPDGGVYALVLRVTRPLRRTVGARGVVTLPPGRYVYVGSARRNARKRIARHFRRDKPRRWHIDHLTTARTVHPVGALLVTDPTVHECALSAHVGRLCEDDAPLPGFGASDCRAGCPAHLWRAAWEVAPADLATGDAWDVLWP